MRYFDAFAGIGGFSLGIERAALSVWNGKTENTITETSEQGMESTSEGVRNNRNITNSELRRNAGQVSCVGYSEIDKYAIKVYEKQFGGRSENTSNQTRGEQPRKERQHERSDVHTESIGKTTYNNGQPPRNYGDITKINAEELPDFDCLVGGFPCQAFSIAGKRKGFEDTRGTLFFDLARILRAKQPRLFVFENVKGLLSHDSGRTFKTIIETIDELGYNCQWQVLNSKNFGVPQNRERVYIVGHLRGTPRPEVFPLESNYGETSNEVTHKGQLVDLTRREPTNYRERTDGRAGTLDANYYKGLANQERPGVIVAQRGRGEPPVQQLEARPDDITNTITSVQKDNMVMIPEATKKGYAEASVGDAINLTAINSKTRRGRVSNIAPTIDTGMQLHTLTEDIRIRRLTPLECERLQGFPDNWTAEGIDGTISDTQRYKMCGNAVTVNVVEAVFERILKGY